MAIIGLKHFVAAKYVENTTEAGVTTITYTNGFVVGKAIKADLSIENNEVNLYADDAVSETDKSFKGGKITLGIADLSNESYCTMTGHTKDETSGEITSKGNDIAPYLGTGFYARKRVNNVDKYRAIWLQKTQYKEPTDSFETKGETIAFQTPSIEGSMAVDPNDVWKTEKTFDKEEEAIAWLNEKAGITATE